MKLLTHFVIAKAQLNSQLTRTWHDPCNWQVFVYLVVSLKLHTILRFFLYFSCI